MRSSAVLLLAGLAALAVVAGCGNDEATGEGPGGAGGNAGAGTTQDGGSPFPAQPLSVFASDAGDLRIELRTAPEQPVHVGADGTAELRVTDAVTGDPIDALQIAAKTWMPVMKHSCSPVPVTVEDLGGGAYLLSPLGATMSGACEIHLTIEGGHAGGAVSPTFDVERD